MHNRCGIFVIKNLTKMSRKETVLAIILLISRKDIRETGAPILSGLAVMPLIIGAFFAYWVFVRHEIMALDIVIYVVAMTGVVHLAKIWRNNRFIRDWWPLWMVVAVVLIVLTGFLTYNAPADCIVFTDLG